MGATGRGAAAVGVTGPGAAAADATGPGAAAAGATAGDAPVAELRAVHLTYGSTPALRGVDLTLRPGQRVALMGASGCGKSTLLHVLVGVLPPDSGAVEVLGHDLTTLPQRGRDTLRRERIGMVFQFGDLVSELTLRENVMLPLRLMGRGRREVRHRAAELLARLGIEQVADRRAGEVSGGQAQRAAVARALVHEPALVLADEPTGSLDTVASEAVMEALCDAVADLGTTLLVVTHDNRVAAYLDQLVTMRDGRVADPGV